jgi:hypothetical protein
MTWSGCGTSSGQPQHYLILLNVLNHGKQFGATIRHTGKDWCVEQENMLSYNAKDGIESVISMNVFVIFLNKFYQDTSRCPRLTKRRWQPMNIIGACNANKFLRVKEDLVLIVSGSMESQLESGSYLTRPAVAPASRSTTHSANFKRISGTQVLAEEHCGGASATPEWDMAQDP